MKQGRETKPHIGLYGRCNAGKSSLLNFLTDAPISIVSPQAGTTTDTVRKSYEILGFAPVVFIDTAGLDDTSALGTQRVERTMETLGQIDLAILVFRTWGTPERELLETFHRLSLPHILVHNIARGDTATVFPEAFETDISAHSTPDREALLDAIKIRLPENSWKTPSLFGDSITPGDVVLLVCPIDSEAPAGRLILPQVQVLRELLDRHAVAITVQPGEIETVLRNITPRLVVTDSQVFPEVGKAVPENVELTSFSILLAGAKGDPVLYKQGLGLVDNLRPGDKILISESCTHQVSCEDIGRMKIPRWLERHTGVELRFTFVSGLTPLPSDIASYALMVQCGGCMITRSQLQNRIRQAAAAGVPVTNYGMLIRKIRK